ncbi:MAG: hypothetical protein QOJ29_3477 [Thermoleophilaceae bacterium]|jgi:sugar lactone lactonase YvrE|nr:hypothetical protein [Thermoleophilaceae bacterium]
MRARLLAITVLATCVLAGAVAHGAAVLTIYTVAGGSGQGFKGDGGAATSASLDGPGAIAIAADGSIIVADTINQRIRGIDAAGRIRTIAGSGKLGFDGDGGTAKSASFQDPTGLAIGKDGSIYVTDTGNSRVRVIKPDGTIATLAGTADQGFSGDGGKASAAQVNAPQGVAVDAGGQLFFSDTGNNRVRVIHADGTIATVAGNGQAGSAGDGGPATSAQLNSPRGLAFQADGTLLIADAGNNRIRRVATNGTIATVAGTGGGGSGGDGGAATDAQLNLPVDVSVLPAGGFFIAEQGGNRIRRVDAQGEIARVAGTGGPRYGGDGHAAGGSLLNAPHGVELMPSGAELLIADTDNNRIRYIAIPGRAARLAMSPLKTPVLAPLYKKKIVVKKKKRRILVVTDVPIEISASAKCRLTIAIATKKGKAVTTIKGTALAGTTAVHLPARLRSGKRRLKKDHYVLRVTATSGSAISTGSLELVVK